MRVLDLPIAVDDSPLGSVRLKRAELVRRFGDGKVPEPELSGFAGPVQPVRDNMTDSSSSVHFRKFSPIDRDHPIFELVDGNDVLLDVGATDDGVVEVAIHEGAINRVFVIADLQGLLREGSRLVEEDLG
ncbi:MAG: hypothetical protein KC933_05620 [Myxococcales bacterium]|nr:hypothetical protein [Myxococcales bacterium]